MVFQDKSLTCVECGSDFVFTADDQQYHSEKGYTNEPKRCPDCRRNRRSMFNQGRGGGGGYGGGARQMHTIVCAECGKEDEVPFQPRGDRPVYCSDCFSQHRTQSSYRY